MAFRNILTPLDPMLKPTFPLEIRPFPEGEGGRILSDLIASPLSLPPILSRAAGPLSLPGGKP